MSQILPPLNLPPNGGGVAPSNPNQGPPGPPGPAGSNSAFVYRDSEPNPSDNVFATWQGAYNAAIATNAPATIIIDSSLNTCSIPLNAGDFDLHQITLSGIGLTIGSFLVINAGVTFSRGLLRITNNLSVNTTSEGIALATMTASDWFGLVMDNGANLINQKSVPLFDLTNSTNNIFLSVDSSAYISGNGAGAEVFNAGNSGINFFVYVGELATVDQYTFAGTSSSEMFQTVNPLAHNYTNVYPSYAGTVNNTSLGKAGLLHPFSSAEPLPNPTGSVYTIETGSMIYDTTNNNPYWWNGSSWQSISQQVITGYATYGTPEPPLTGVGSMVYNTFNQIPYWWNGSGWQASYLGGDITGVADNNSITRIQGHFLDTSNTIDGYVITYTAAGSEFTLRPAGVPTEFINATLNSPQTGVNPGDFIIWNKNLARSTSIYLDMVTPDQFILNFSSGPNVSFKLIADINAITSGNFDYQWWDITNNVGLGNISSSTGNAVPDEIIAIVPYNYSITSINVGVKILGETGSTTLGGTSNNGNLIVPWALVETIGVPR